MDTTNRQIIGIHGPAGSGKSELSAHLVNTHGFSPTKFAAPLKNMIAVLLCSAGICTEDNFLDYLEGSLKEEPIELFGGATCRHLMQTLGTEWGRNAVHPDFWVRTWFGGVSNFQDSVVVDDVRFENEAETIRAMGGTIIHLYRDNRKRNPGDHVSERVLRHFQVIILL